LFVTQQRKLECWMGGRLCLHCAHTPHRGG